MNTEWFNKNGSQLKLAYYNPVEYEKLGSILKNYHVGLILYKDLITNFVYNALNKLFEYLSCGLDVWHPFSYGRNKTYKNNGSPKVSEINFDAPPIFNIHELVSK